MVLLNIAVCDDETGAIEKLENLIDRYFENKAVTADIHKFTSGNSLLQTDVNLYDIIFLDIKIGNENGLDIASELNKMGCTAVLMLISKYQRFLRDGYRVGAFRFLLKQSIEKTFDSEMDSALEELNIKKQQFSFQVYNKTYNVDYDDIIYFMSDGHKVKVVAVIDLPKDEFTGKIDSVEKYIDGDRFIRISHSYLVNINRIKAIRAYTAYLDTGEELSVSRNGYSGIEEKYVRIKRKLNGIADCKMKMH